MGVVHGLESNSGVIAIEVAVLDEVFDGVDDLIAAKLASNVYLVYDLWVTYALQKTGLF